jgi:hypothetical protein
VIGAHRDTLSPVRLVATTLHLAQDDGRIETAMLESLVQRTVAA